MKERSPKFPFIRLEKAVRFIPALIQLDEAKKLTRPAALEAMGYSSLNGAAAKAFAALHAYDLIAPSDNGPCVTSTGRALAEAKTDGEKLPHLQRAALSPLVFRNLWRRARLASVEEIAALLEQRSFTSKGATRAGRVYRNNASFAKLDELQVEPALPEREKTGMGKKRAKKKAAQIERRLREKMQESQRAKTGVEQGARTPANSLHLPLSAGKVIVPKGITEEEFTLLIQTLRIWKPQLVSG